MNDTLLIEIAELEAKKVELQGQFSISTNISERQNIIDDLSRIEKKITEIRTQQDKVQAIEEKVHNEAVPFAIEGVDFTQLPAQLITVIEKVVKADRRRIYAEHALELEHIENEYDEYKQNAEGNISGLQANLSVLQQDYDNAARELKEQTEETIRLIAERDEARKNRDNASAQLEEAKAENERLKSEIDDYRKAKVYGEREAQSVIDVTPTEAEDINNAIKQFLTSEDWGSVIKATKADGSFELVKRDEFNSQWQQVGGSETPAGTFQGEAAEAITGGSGVSDTEGQVIYEQVPSYPQENGDGNGLAEESSSVAGSPVSRQEFEALSARVSQLEQSSVKAA